MVKYQLTATLNGKPIKLNYTCTITVLEHPTPKQIPCVIRLDRLTPEQINAAINGNQIAKKQTKIDEQLAKNLIPCVVRLDRLTSKRINAAIHGQQRPKKQTKIYQCEYFQF